MAIVAVVDTGANLNHIDLRDNLWTNPGEIPGNRIDDDNNGVIDDVHGFDVITGQAISQIGDPEGHGSHVAGIVTTTSPQAEIMTIRLLGPTGGGSLSNAIQAWSYALLEGADVINNSWGALGVAPSQVRFMQEVVDLGEQNFNAVFVAAAGNESTNTDRVPNTPSNTDRILSVGASNSRGKPAGFSNFGKRTVDLFAPGVQILSADAFSNTARIPLSGTSMASPVVAGAVATLIDREPNAAAGAIRQEILDGVVRRRKLRRRSIAGGVLANEFTGPFTAPLRSGRGRKGARQARWEEPNDRIQLRGDAEQKAGSMNYKTIVCVLDEKSVSTKQAVHAEIEAQPFTESIEWPAAFDNKICILRLKRKARSKKERHETMKEMHDMDHFSSVEWDRFISINAKNSEHPFPTFNNDLVTADAFQPAVEMPF